MNILLRFKLFRWAKIGLSLSLMLSITGCQLISQPASSQSSYGQYYLWLKSLNNEEILAEITQQKQSFALGNSQAGEYLLLLHSLPNSPIHNAYTAKSMINKRNNQYLVSHYNPTILAFITVLKDQFNQQLLILEKFANKSAELKLNEQQHYELNQEKIKNKALIVQLKRQIVQLKIIEQSINERGQ